ncbi:MAG: carbonic anhydrase family protein [Neisseriaceae bacterium]|nr:carbonic anhydrase family protein [Neisseriaceae bacterium]
MKKILLNTLLSLSMGVASAAHFGYDGEHSPEHWGDLHPDFAACKTGKFQSPIDITDSIEVKTHKALNFSYPGNADTIVNNGHTIQVNFQKDDGVLNFENKQFKLLQIHFHTPSEYTFNGEHFPMVGHIVHQADDGQLLVVAVMFQEGEENPVIADIWKNAPKKANQNKAMKKVAVQKLVENFNAYYRLEGSLTTPPCTEGVMWIIGKEPVTASKAQMETFTKIIGKNNRPVQKANGRAVIMSQ